MWCAKVRQLSCGELPGIVSNRPCSLPITRLLQPARITRHMATTREESDKSRGSLVATTGSWLDPCTPISQCCW